MQHQLTGCRQHSSAFYLLESGVNELMNAATTRTLCDKHYFADRIDVNMNRKIIIWIVFVVISLGLIIIDYSEYVIDESELEQVVIDQLSDITYPEDLDYQIEDEYNEGRIRFYSGQVHNIENRGPFIIGFRRHWLMPVYTNTVLHLSYTRHYIPKPGETIDTYLFKYMASQADNSHKLTVERRINYAELFPFCIVVITVFFEIRRKKMKL